MEPVELKRVSINFTNNSTIQGKWKEPFNQATFFNYDTTTAVIINSSLTLPPAQIVGGFVYPSQFTISLNTDEVNDTYYTFDFRNSITRNLQIVYSQYLDRHFH